VVLITGLVVYVSCTVLFALLLLACPRECFRLDAGRDFAAMLYISIHVFSTVGFGNLAPVQKCALPQLIVLVESFVSLLVYSAIGGYVVKMFLRPLSRVRFSKVILMNNGRRRPQTDDPQIDDDDVDGDLSLSSSWNSRLDRRASATNGASGLGGILRRRSLLRTQPQPPQQPPQQAQAQAQQSPPPSPPTATLSELSALPVQHTFITFRMVRQGHVELRDVRVKMQAQYWVAGSTAFGDRDSHKGRVVNLELEQDYFTTLEQLQVGQSLARAAKPKRHPNSLQPPSNLPPTSLYVPPILVAPGVA
jgi:hypothetical protein